MHYNIYNADNSYACAWCGAVVRSICGNALSTERTYRPQSLTPGWVTTHDWYLAAHIYTNTCYNLQPTDLKKPTSIYKKITPNVPPHTKGLLPRVPSNKNNNNNNNNTNIGFWILFFSYTY